MTIQAGSAPSENSAWTVPSQSPAAPTKKLGVVQTGPSGLVLGRTTAGPMVLRLFRREGTRVVASVNDYVTWLLAFRSVALGAHLTVVTGEPRRWRVLKEVVEQGGGTIDIATSLAAAPGQGRPYRPSLIIDDLADGSSDQLRVGAWQCLVVIVDAGQPNSVNVMRNSDMTILSRVDQRVQDNLKRSYAIGQLQLRQALNLTSSDIMIAMPRRLVRVNLPPTRSEYDLLFDN